MERRTDLCRARRAWVLLLNEQLREAGIAGSIGTVADSYDNALQKSAIGLYKSELTDIDRTRNRKSRQEVETATAKWVH